MNLPSDDHATRPSARRFVAFGAIAAALLLGLGIRLFHVQVVDGHVYAERAARQRTVELAIPAPRGLVFDRTGRPVAVNAPAWTAAIRPADLPPEHRDEVLTLLGDLTGAERRDLERRLEEYSGSPLDLVRVVRGLSRETAVLLGEHSERLIGVEIEVESVRRYLDETGAVDGELMAHVIGYTGRVDPEELAVLTDRGYLHDDVIGKTGVEGGFEAELRGAPGSRLAERDASGRIVKVIESLDEPVPGTNLMLTVDARTQRLATEALAWGMEVANVTHGATVVMNPQTGEILAMVSLPAHDANAFAGGIGPEQFASYLADPSRPLRNHGIADIYAPGSTFKLVTAIAALEEGVTTPDRLWPTYACFQIPGAAPGECLYDWNRQGFGPLDVVDAFAHSSDTFFYQMALETGADSLARWARELGFGEATGIELQGEADGIVPSAEWLREQGREPLYSGELAQVGIGQSLVAATPLQVLNAYAAIANGGRLMRPTVIRGETDADGVLTVPRQPEVLRTLAADADTLQTLRLAARDVIATGHAYNIRDLALPGALSGKTGTAEFGEPAEDGSLPFHSWFVAWLPSAAGATDAELAIVTFSYGATVPGNVSIEVVKHFLQLYYELDQDLRLDPNDFSLVAGN